MKRLRVTCVLILAACARPLAGQITVGPNVHVSRTLSDSTHHEVWLCADPEDANRLLAVSMMSRKVPSFNVAYTSTDGGRSWRHTLTDSAHGADPTCAFGPGHRAHFATMSSDAQKLGRVWHSLDGGLHWTASRPQVPFVFYDRDFLTADTTKGPFMGRVYVSVQTTQPDANGRARRAIGLYRSLDGGASYEPPLIVSPETGYDVQTLNNTVLDDGTVLVLYCQWKPFDPTFKGRVNETLKIIASHDGGKSFGAPVTVGSLVLDRNHLPSMQGVIAADPGSKPFAGRVYVVWHDAASGAARVRISYSTDRGATWSTARAVDYENVTPLASGELPNSWALNVAVNRNGVVGVLWYDRRGSVDNLGYTPRFSASLDGGETWLPSVAVSARPSVRSPTAPSRGAIALVMPSPAEGGSAGGGAVALRIGMHTAFAGHTNGLVADASGKFHALWVDNRTGLNQVWAAPIAVTGTVTDPVGAAIASLTDVSKLLTFGLAWRSGSDAQNEMTMDLVVRGASAQRIAAPLKIWIGALVSGRGIPRVIDAASGRPVEQTIFDISSALGGRSLALGDSIVIPGIRFRVDGYRPATAIEEKTTAYWQYGEFMKLEVRAFSTATNTESGRR